MSSSTFCAVGSEELNLQDDDIKSHLYSFLDSLGPKEDVLILPPDYTRFHSQAGKITRFISEYYNFTKPLETLKETARQKISTPDECLSGISETSSSQPSITIIPALGTHMPMTKEQIKSMFGKNLSEKIPNPFIVHDWRNDVVTIGHAPAQMVKDATYGMVDQEWPAQLNKHVWEKRKFDSKKQKHKTLVLSVGQVVPHEVMGMANFNKNLFVGVGGVEAINLSHFIGAVHGMEKMMGRESNPLRSILNYASENFLQGELDLWYVLTVMGTNKDTDDIEMKGLYIGKDIECYSLACDLSVKVNFTILERAPKKIVVWLDGDEFHSTWLGNKAIYRTRMAIADGGEILILAPGVKQFGEDKEIDSLIRTFGFKGTAHILEEMKKSDELKSNLSAVAHLMHSSSEGRFHVTYCPGHLTKDEIESVGFHYQDLSTMMELYNISELKDGWNERVAGGEMEEFYFIRNPALGLWTVRDRFENRESTSAASHMISGAICETGKQSCSTDGCAGGGVGGWARPPCPE